MISDRGSRLCRFFVIPRIASYRCRGPSTLGNFDGIHLGHQALLRSAVDDARRLGSPSVVLTFEPHPLKVLAPERAPKLLLAHKDKMQLFQSFGVDIIVMQHFNASFT